MMRSLLSAVGYKAPVPKKRSVALLRSPTSDVLSKRSECVAITRRLDAWAAKVEELE